MFFENFYFYFFKYFLFYKHAQVLSALFVHNFGRSDDDLQLMHMWFHYHLEQKKNLEWSLRYYECVKGNILYLKNIFCYSLQSVIFEFEQNYLAKVPDRK
jgi:hypothetical protein